MKRSYSLDLLKLVFAYVIAFFHFGHPFAPGPTVTVQVFFFISGFFLARKYYARSHADQGSSYNQWQYTLDHVKGLYPHYVFSYAAYVLYVTARAVLSSPTVQQLRELCLTFYDQIPNLLLLQSSYYSHDSLNYPLWQLSALLIGGYFVYGLLCHNEKLSRQLLFPAAILMLLTLQHTGTPFDGHFGPIYMPLLRAFGGLSFGVLVFYFTTTAYFEQLKSRRIPFNLAVLGSLICIFVFADHGNIHYITAALVILGCYTPDSWINALLNRRLFRHFGKLSLSIYVNHALVIRFTSGWLLPHLAGWGVPRSALLDCGIYFFLLTAYSIFTLRFVELLVSRRKQRKAAPITAKD